MGELVRSNCLPPFLRPALLRVEVRIVVLLVLDFLPGAAGGVGSSTIANEDGRCCLARTGRPDLVLTIFFFPVDGFDMHIAVLPGGCSNGIAHKRNKYRVVLSSRPSCRQMIQDRGRSLDCRAPTPKLEDNATFVSPERHAASSKKWFA